jgi:hypothetical protein
MRKVSEFFRIGDRQLLEASIGLLSRSWVGASQKQLPPRPSAQSARLGFFGPDATDRIPGAFGIQCDGATLDSTLGFSDLVVRPAAMLFTDMSLNSD